VHITVPHKYIVPLNVAVAVERVIGEQRTIPAPADLSSRPRRDVFVSPFLRASANASRFVIMNSRFHESIGSWPSTKAWRFNCHLTLLLPGTSIVRMKKRNAVFFRLSPSTGIISNKHVKVSRITRRIENSTDDARVNQLKNTMKKYARGDN